MRRTLVITGGTIDLDFAADYLARERFDKVIAVDAGLAAASALGMVPDMIVGDFDTVDRKTLERFEAMEHVIWDVHRPEKDETDTELALIKARAIGSTQIVVLGATGGRADHMLANLHLLYPCLQSGIETILIDPQNKIYLLDGEHTFERGKTWGKYVSFLPLTEQVRGITLTGFRYPLQEKDISIGTSLCVSNELVAERATITFEDGVLICVEARD